MRKILTSLTAAVVALSALAAPQGELAKRRTADSPRGINLAEVNARGPLRAASKAGTPRVHSMTGRHAAGFSSKKRLPLASRVQQAPAFAVTSSASVQGVVIYQADWSDTYAPLGLYTVPLSASVAAQEIFTSDYLSNGGFYDGQYIYTPVYTTFWGYVLGCDLSVVDARTGELVSQYEMPLDNQIYTATYVPALDAAIAWGGNSSQKYIFKMSLTGELEALASTSVDLIGGLATAADGTVYGIDLAGMVYTVNTSTGAVTRVASSGVSNDYVSSLVYDDASGLLIYPTCVAVDDETEISSLYTIDPTGGTATKLYDYATATEYGLLFIPRTFNALAPAAPELLVADFAGGSLSGTISFLPPAATVEGAAGSGALTYSVCLNGSEVSTGQTTFGAAKVSVPVTVQQAGDYSVKVTVSNSAGVSDPARTSLYIGPDIPADIARLTVTRSGSDFQLSWSAPESTHGGYINEAEVTYELVRYVNDTPTTLTSTLKGVTTYKDTYADPTSGLENIYYTVQATYDGVTTAATASNHFVLGNATLPYDENFASASAADFFTVLDANQDEITWEYDGEKQAMYYSYDSDNTGNDYLILPALPMEAGKAYEITFLAGARSANYPESVALYAGTAPTATGLSVELIPSSSLNSVFAYSESGSTGQSFKANYVPASTGLHYIAIKATSPTDSFGLYVTNIHVSAARSAAAPGAVSGLTLEADATGEPVVTIKFTAPTTCIDGSTLTSLDHVNIFRGSELIKELAATPGQACTYVDNEAGEGNVTYTLEPVNNAGNGVTSSATVYVGLNRPAVPASLSYGYGADFGEIVLTWPAVTQDINGLPISDVRYLICQPNSQGTEWVPFAENVSGTSYTFRATTADADPDFGTFAVFAENDYGTSPGGASALVPLGRSETMPFRETVTGGDIAHNMGISNVGGSWALGYDGYFEGVNSSDADNGFFYFQAEQAGANGSLFTTRIHIDADAVAPAFSFYYFCQSAEDTNTLQPIVNLGNGFINLGDAAIAGNGEQGAWMKYTVRLDQYKGQDLLVGIKVQANRMAYTLVDNFEVANLSGHDLGITATAPAEVAPGNNLTISARVSNEGIDTQDSYTVDFYVDSRVVYSTSGSNLAPGASANFSYDYPVTAGAADIITVKAVVNAAGDTNADNDSSREIEVQVRHTLLPAPKNLEYSVSTDGVTFTWTEPDVNDPAALYTVDGFESADSFATAGSGNAAGWTFVDADQGAVGGFQGTTLPGITPEGKATWFVFDDTDYDATFTAFGGNKYLAVLFNLGMVQNDDWAISPELDGRAQTISFMARAYDAQYPETLELLYSTGSTDPADFVAVKTISGITTQNREWTKYSFDVPQGAKRFALRFRSRDTFMLMLDDVSYIPAGVQPLELVGYNVYRNGEKINESVLTSTVFLETGEHKDARYVVTAVYKSGESKGSNACYPFGNYIEVVEGMSVRGLVGAMEVSGTQEAVSIYDLQGRMVYSGASGRVEAAPGLYIVKIGRASKKVMVR